MKKLSQTKLAKKIRKTETRKQREARLDKLRDDDNLMRLKLMQKADVKKYYCYLDRQISSGSFSSDQEAKYYTWSKTRKDALKKGLKELLEEQKELEIEIESIKRAIR